MRLIYVPKNGGYLVNPKEGWVYRRGRKSYGSYDGKGYLQVTLNYKRYMLHRVIFEAVHGPIPEGKELNHKNGIKTDCRIENLEVTTRSGNMLHAYATGLHKRKLAPETIAEIKKEWKQGESAKRLAFRFNVHPETIYKIVSGRGHYKKYSE